MAQKSNEILSFRHKISGINSSSAKFKAEFNSILKKITSKLKFNLKSLRQVKIVINEAKVDRCFVFVVADSSKILETNKFLAENLDDDESFKKLLNWSS